MSFYQEKIRPLLATARIANVPSVVSNIWLGAAAVILAQSGRQILWLEILLISLSGISLYIAGNFLNDWFDQDWDRKNRPERALPSGRYGSKSYLVSACLLGSTGLILAALASWAAPILAALLILFIVIYTVWHKRTVWAVIPMGLCRACLPLMGALAIFPRQPGFEHAFGLYLAAAGSSALFCYIMGLSMSARYESLPTPAKSAWILPRTLLLAPTLITAALLLAVRWPFRFEAILLLAFLPFLAWLAVVHSALRKPIPKYVSGLLAGIPLVDWTFLLPVFLLAFSRSQHGPLEWVCLLLPPVAFVSALLLQRVAPAT